MQSQKREPATTHQSRRTFRKLAAGFTLFFGGGLLCFHFARIMGLFDTWEVWSKFYYLWQCGRDFFIFIVLRYAHPSIKRITWGFLIYTGARLLIEIISLLAFFEDPETAQAFNENAFPFVSLLAVLAFAALIYQLILNTHKEDEE